MRYQTGAALKAAIDARLKRVAAEQGQATLVRVRKHIAFERFLARLLTRSPESWMLKGGVAMDYRLGDRARATQDIDLLYIPSDETPDEQIADVETIDLDDYFTFTTQRTGKLDRLTDGSAVRYRIEASLSGRRFEAFSLDVGFDLPDNLQGDLIVRPGFLDFAGVTTPECRVLPIEVHLAEKLHAYARSYSSDRPSSRVKGLIDMVLIAQSIELNAHRCYSAIQYTFETRQVYPVPDHLLPPPEAWAATYPTLARSVSNDPDMAAGHTVAAALFDPLLAGIDGSATWIPADLVWRVPPGRMPPCA